VPVTVIACEFPSAKLREWMEQGHPYVRELAKIRDVDSIDLGLSAAQPAIPGAVTIACLLPGRA
jgi:hypothetical protein